MMPSCLLHGLPVAWADVHRLASCHAGTPGGWPSLPPDRRPPQLLP